MTLTTKILLALLAMVVLGSAGFIAYKANEISQKQDAINKSIVEFQQLKDDIARSQSQFATKDDLNTFAKQSNINLDDIKKNLDKLNANVTGVNKVVIVTPGTDQYNLPSTNVTPNPNPKPSTTPDEFGYLANEQHLALNEQFSGNQVPFGSVGFSAWQKQPWQLTIAPRKYSITNVLGTDENNRHYIYNKFSINTGGKDYDVKIADAKFVEEYPEPHFSFWNPRLFLGTDLGVSISKLPIKAEFTPNLSLGVMSYGKSKVTPDWSFVQVGVGYGTVERTLEFQISPFQYNIGKPIPLINNTYVGPVIGIGINGNITIGAGLRVGL